MRRGPCCGVAYELAGNLQWIPAYFFGDSMNYLNSGRRIARALFLRDFSGLEEAGRSLIYSLGILPFHLNIDPWPIVGLNAVLTAYVLWLVVRSVLSRRILVGYFTVVVILSLFTSLSWFVSLIMPDILGPVLYLSIYLVAFCWGALSRGERLALVLIACWALVSHASHLVVAAGICILFALLLVCQTHRRGLWQGAFIRVTTILLVGVLAQLTLHIFLFREFSLVGKQYPVLLARVIADGPGRWYLQRTCPKVNLAICEDVEELPDAPWKFLWKSDGIWQSSPAAKRERLKNEEMRVVLGTIRAYPWAQFYFSAVNFWHQLNSFGLEQPKPTPAARRWVLGEFDKGLPSAKSNFLESRQVLGILNKGFFTLVQDWLIKISLMVIGVSALLRGRSWPTQLVGLTTVITYVVIANAAVTGILSSIENRYQARLVWLVPLLAGVFVLTWAGRAKQR